MPVRIAAALALWIGLTPGVASAAPDPAEATVFIRAIGRARALRGEDARAWREALLDERNVPLSTGTGVVVSPQGYIITNLHVVSSERRMVTVQSMRVDVSIEIERIEVELPARRGSPLRRVVASVVASDADLDLAILHVGVSDLPYAALGDSDVVAPGEPVRAMGYPFGAALEIGRTLPVEAPQISVTSGTVSARRSDDAGGLRFLQTTAPISPGSSGGPMVDAEGYVVGIVQSKLRADNNVGFTIPVNVVKRWLQLNGLDTALPARLLAAGPSIEARAKGLHIPAPYGLSDQSPIRARVDSGPGPIALRIDRIVSPWSLGQLEAALLNGGTFESFTSARAGRYPAATGDARGTIAGHASGTDASGRELKVEYALVDLGREKIVARYIGEAEAVATNRGMLHASLAAIDVEPLLTRELTAATEVRWTIAESAAGVSTLPLPAEWVLEAGAPSRCEGLAEPSAAVSLSPAGDFTVGLRGAWWTDAPFDLVAAARACSRRRGASGDASYALRADFAGTSFTIEGVFIRRPGGGVQQIEMIAPVEKADAARTIFQEWVGRLTPL